MVAATEARQIIPFNDMVRKEVEALTSINEPSRNQFAGIIDLLPLAYNNVPAIFRSVEKKTAGQGGLFSIFFSDLFKGCGECGLVLGENDGLRVKGGTRGFNGPWTTPQIFSPLLPA